jgi:hypothetical protein
MKAALRETFHTEPEALPIVNEQFERSASAIAEDEERA